MSVSSCSWSKMMKMRKMRKTVDDWATWSRWSFVRVFVEPSAQSVDVNLKACVKALTRTGLLRLTVCRLTRCPFVVVIVAFFICLVWHVAQTEMEQKTRTDVFYLRYLDALSSPPIMWKEFFASMKKMSFYGDDLYYVPFMAAEFFFHFSSFLSILSFFLEDRERGFI